MKTTQPYYKMAYFNPKIQSYLKDWLVAVWRNSLLTLQFGSSFDPATQSEEWPKEQFVEVDSLPLSHFLLPCGYGLVRTDGLGWEP